MSCEQLVISVEQNIVKTCLEVQTEHECAILEPQLLQTLEIVSRGPQGPPGDPGIEAIIEVNAAENLPAFSVVTATGFNADSNNLGHFGKVIGLTESAIATGFIATVITDLELTNNAWSWTPGTKIYLNGTSLSATPPSSGFSQRVAVAENSTTIIVGLGPPVLL